MSEKKEEIPSEPQWSRSIQRHAIERWRASHLTMVVQALANIMFLGLNWRVLIGPWCFPSKTATFIPLSVLHMWTLPSSEPAWKNTVEDGWGEPDATSRASSALPTNHDKLRVRRETSLQGFAFTVVVALGDTKRSKEEWPALDKTKTVSVWGDGLD